MKTLLKSALVTSMSGLHMPGRGPAIQVGKRTGNMNGGGERPESSLPKIGTLTNESVLDSISASRHDRNMHSSALGFTAG